MFVIEDAFMNLSYLPYVIIGKMGIDTKGGKMDIQFRLGTVDDAGMIVGLINELAEYEKLPDKITTTE